MSKVFNVTGNCISDKHYMVDLTSRLEAIRKMIDKGQYFCINRGRQYGKTTTLKALKKYLQNNYIVVNLDFQGLSTSDFKTEESFVKAFARELWMNRETRNFMDDDTHSEIKKMKSSTDYVMADLFSCISEWCMESERPVVLLIDEVDSASNNQIFLDFLAQLRRYYLNRTEHPTFQSVILAGVHDIRNLRQRIRSDTEHKHNSPWNIASAFNIDMSFSPDDIARMLTDYEDDHHTNMNIAEISQLIYDYTSGYPVLVSSICKLMDEKNQDWTKNTVTASAKELMAEKIPLIESLINKLEDNENLRKMLYSMLFHGKKYLYNAYDSVIGDAVMYGFVKNYEGSTVIANRIFETVIYDGSFLLKLQIV